MLAASRIRLENLLPKHIFLVFWNIFWVFSIYDTEYAELGRFNIKSDISLLLELCRRGKV